MPVWRRALSAWRSRCAPSLPTSSTYFHPDHESPMEASLTLTRRGLLAAALTLGAMQVFPGLSKAQARRLVFATFTGSWEEAHMDVLVSAFRTATKAEVVQDA